MNADLTHKLEAVLRISPGDENAAVKLSLRIAGIGLAHSCPRCSGTGKHSWTQVHGDVCFRCGGTGRVMPRITAKLVDAATSRVSEGKLDEYFAANRLRKLARESASKWHANTIAARIKYTDNRPDLSDDWTAKVVNYNSRLSILASAILAAKAGIRTDGDVTKLIDLVSAADAYRAAAVSDLKKHPGSTNLR